MARGLSQARSSSVGAYPRDRSDPIDNIKHVYWGLIVVSILLLVLAGTIEAYVSPVLVKALLISAR